jgi:hypothetical protein
MPGKGAVCAVLPQHIPDEKVPVTLLRLCDEPTITASSPARQEMTEIRHQHKRTWNNAIKRRFPMTVGTKGLKLTVILGALALSGAAIGVTTSPAQAAGVSVGIGLPIAPPVVVAPPVVAAPPPVVYAAPGYVGPGYVMPAYGGVNLDFGWHGGWHGDGHHEGWHHDGRR